MKKYLISLASLLLVAALISCSAPSQTDILPSETAQPEKVEPARTQVPVVIKEWTGSTTKTTEPFTIESDVWAISWSFTPEPVVGIYANIFSVSVMKPGSAQPESIPVSLANTKQPVSDESYIYERGTFYLDINAMSGTWAIQVIAFEEGKQ